MPPRAIKAIFFTRFHHEKGSRVLHQVPEGSITPSNSSSALAAPLFDFDAVTTYIIPTQQFCDRLMTFCTNHHRIIGYPVCVREGKYNRNEYIFNFALVIDEAIEDWAAYGEVARKMGRLLRGLEEQGGFLSREEEDVLESDDKGSGSGSAYPVGEYGSKVYALCETVLEDLNNYAECMIPIDESNTINLKLFPAHPPPPPIHSYQVPLLSISLSSLTSPISSDLTLTRIVPYINGVNSVARIAHLADTDLSLTRKALQHLAYYGCLILLDIFQFSNVYAPTADIGAFITDKSVQEECARFVCTPRYRMKMSNGANGSGNGTGNGTGNGNGSTNTRSRGREGSSDSSHSSIRRPSQDTIMSSSAMIPNVRSSDTLNTIASRSSRSSRTPFRPDLTSPRSSTFSARGSTTSKHPFSNPSDQDHDLSDFELSDSPPALISGRDLIRLYTSLRQGLTLRAWVTENMAKLGGIDVRRFITFGLVKGFLYRCHRYAIVTNAHNLPPAPPTSLQDEESVRRFRGGTTTPRGELGREWDKGKSKGKERERERERDADSDAATIRNAPGALRHPHKSSLAPAMTTAATVSHLGPVHGPALPPKMQEERENHEHLARLESMVARASPGKNGMHGPDGTRARDVLPLVKFLVGMHSFDEICTETGMPMAEVEEKIKGVGDVTFFYR